MSTPSDAVVYQLKVVLAKISPMIWRRFLVHGETTLADLHYILQIAFGWSDEHLHRFILYGKEYGIPRIGGTGSLKMPVRFASSKNKGDQSGMEGNV